MPYHTNARAILSWRIYPSKNSAHTYPIIKALLTILRIIIIQVTRDMVLRKNRAGYNEFFNAYNDLVFELSRHYGDDSFVQEYFYTTYSMGEKENK